MAGAAVAGPIQPKVNLLVGAFIAFTLVAVPVFIQVKADTRESVKEASQTLLWRVSEDFQGNFQPDNPEDIDIEDAWRQEAEEENPGCGAECDPEGDLDGDGQTNSEELENGTNPACDEATYGQEQCQQADQHNLTTPEDLPPLSTRELLFSETQSGSPTGGGDTFLFSDDDRSWSRLEIIVNGTLGGDGFTLQLFSPEGGPSIWSAQWSQQFPPQEQPVGMVDNATDDQNGDYEFMFDFQPQIYPVLPPSTVSVEIYGVVD